MNLIASNNRHLFNDFPMEVWSIDLRNYRQDELIMLSFLDENEKKKAQQFKFEHLKTNHILSHGILRWLLSRYLQISPSDISFSYGPFGKPYLLNKDIHFNMSHSLDRSLYAFSFEKELGVDIEYIKPNLSIKDLPLSVLSVKEQENIKTLSLHEQKAAFYKKWTQKEAYLKAIGTGLQNNIAEISIPPTPEWHYFEIPLPSDYVATIAATSFPNTHKEESLLLRQSLELPIRSLYM